jgi:hypothetical protein
VGVNGVDAKHSVNFSDDAFDIPHHIVVPESQHGEPLISKILVPHRVRSTAGGEAVLTAVDFNDQACRKASEVDDKVIDGHLAAEMKAAWLYEPQLRPQPALSVGLIVAQLACTPIGHFKCLLTPPRRASAPTLPVKGRVSCGQSQDSAPSARTETKENNFLFDDLTAECVSCVRLVRKKEPGANDGNEASPSKHSGAELIDDQLSSR